ncbi:hypothetical protein M569_15223 [Genlisea aurea]|uniref:Homeobox domain-containing protein n=1 Tax=Genlisea aurea TaxID=192259 RepID=S8DA61_9LAMI|nr:hypothetical protein M569_15223 [Genlisea aurea]
MNSVVAGDLDANIDGDSGDGVSPSERRDLREKVAKLSAMLGEVERRYRLYCDQMQDLVSSFDMSAGRGASSRYTSVAFRTISRQFRRLQNAIRKEMESCRRRLGERDDDKSSSSAVVLSRLRHVDRHFYQQQQQQQQKGYRIEQTWRPQRGLPETAVSILRAWLFEHFLHPYPKDSEKLVLARQTGLSRSQVANWFINARVRLWKPMIEEMYREEFSEEDEFGSKEPNSASGFRQDDEDDSNATAKNNDTTTENVSLELGLQKTTTASISSISEAYYADAHLLSTDYVT